MEYRISTISTFIALWDETIGPMVIGKILDPPVIPHVEEIANVSPTTIVGKNYMAIAPNLRNWSGSKFKGTSIGS